MIKKFEVFMMCALFSIATALLSQTRERADVAVEHTWNVADLYASNDLWKATKAGLSAEFPAILRYKGKLAQSPLELLGCLQLRSKWSRTFTQLYVYAGLLSDQDTRDADALSMRQEMAQMAVDFSTQLAFIEPEIAAMPGETIDLFLQKEKGLDDYKLYLYDIQRRKAHKLSEKEEKLIAEAGLMADAPYSIYSIFSNAELAYPTVMLSDGTEVLVDQAGYGRYRALPNRQDRERVFEAFFNTLQQYRRTFGAQLYANLKKDMFYARARNYANTLESALDENNIPVTVYHNLIDNINRNLPTFHRYLQLRKRMLGVDTLKYSDLYAPVVKGVDLQYDYPEAKEMILAALKPLGKPYTEVLNEAFANRWIDLYPTTGKRSGAYSNGSAYDVHPYILMNYNGQYDAVSTLAHELGHALHSHFSNNTQSYPKADYPIFVAEVASTLNEALLIDYMLKRIKEDEVRLSLLMSYLDHVKGTLFRQTQFAEFELRIHEAAERGEPLTDALLTRLYSDIFKKYYGHDAGVCVVDDLYTLEWAYIPHFYYNYYVYQYSTAFTASTALSQKILTGEAGAVERFLQFIAAGGSDYPIALLKTAGVDMTTAEPFEKAMGAMNKTMDEIEKILGKKGL